MSGKQANLRGKGKEILEILEKDSSQELEKDDGDDDEGNGELFYYLAKCLSHSILRKMKLFLFISIFR